MKSLNEQLAVEVMDMCQPPEPDGYWWKDNGNDGLEQFIPVNRWKPDSNLNQLRMCYEALSAGQQYKLRCDLVDQGMGPMLIFHNPELVAHAILQAKGVS